MPKLTVSKSYYGSNGTVNNPKNDFFVFALNSQLNPENELLFITAALGFGCKQLHGCYQQVQEIVYLIPVIDNKYADVWKAIRKLAQDFDQECVLYVEGESKNTSLMYIRGYETSKHIGTFTRISASEAISSGDWTLDGNQFWGVK